MAFCALAADLSAHQGRVNWPALKTAGLYALILRAGYSYRYVYNYDSKALAGSIFKKASSGKLAFAKSVSNLPMVIVGGGGDAHTNTQTIKIGSRTIATKAGTLGTVKKVTVSASANEEITVDGDYNGSQWFLAVL